MQYEKWADVITGEEKFKCDECGAEACSMVFEPDENSPDGQRLVGYICPDCLARHPEIYDIRYEDHCIAWMTVEQIKKNARSGGAP